MLPNSKHCARSRARQDSRANASGRRRNLEAAARPLATLAALRAPVPPAIRQADSPSPGTPPAGRAPATVAVPVVRCVVLERALPAPWRPLFALLAYTGARIGATQGLLWGDVRFAERRIILSEAARRLKNVASARILPVPEPLAHLLASYAVSVPTGPADPVFPGHLGNYVRAIRAFRRACKEAGLAGLVPHDLRHTFAVSRGSKRRAAPTTSEAAWAATPAMVMRYAAHAPEAYLHEDAARIAASLSGKAEREAQTRRSRPARSEAGVSPTIHNFLSVPPGSCLHLAGVGLLLLALFAGSGLLSCGAGLPANLPLRCAPSTYSCAEWRFPTARRSGPVASCSHMVRPRDLPPQSRCE